MAGVRERYQISERWVCRLLFQWRGTQRYQTAVRNDEDAFTKATNRAGERLRPLRLLPGHLAAASGGLEGGKDRVECIAGSGEKVVNSVR